MYFNVLPIQVGVLNQVLQHTTPFGKNWPNFGKV